MYESRSGVERARSSLRAEVLLAAPSVSRASESPGVAGVTTATSALDVEGIARPIANPLDALLHVEDRGEVSRRSLGPEFDAAADPGSRQHAALERLSDLVDRDGGSLSDGEVVEVMAAWARQAAAAEAQVRAWAGVLATRPSMSPVWRSSSGRPWEIAADEIAVRLGVSRRRAQQLIGEGRALSGALWPVQEELAAGRIDAGKAALLVQALEEQEPHVVLAVCEQVIPVAASLDHEGLRRRVQQVIVQVDPREAGARHERAVRRRRVNRVRVLSDGMASFSAVLAAPDALALEQACEAAARAARAGGDGRTLEQLRADALVSMGVAALTDQTLALLPRPGSSGKRRQDVGLPVAAPVAFSGRSATLTVIATAAVQRGCDAVPVLADVAAHDLYDWEPDPWDSGFATATDTGAVTGAGDGAGDGTSGTGSTSGTEEPRPEGVEPGRGGLRTQPRQGLDPGNDPYVDWNPPPTFRPGIDAPELVGFGAISPSAVRALMGRAPWVRVVAPVPRDADPPPPVDSYRPSAELDRFVRRRDVTCVVPGCHVPASRCDVDHLVPWPAGPTAAANLHALCRHHHLAKTHAGHDLAILADGTLRWTTRLGQVLHRTPDGLDTRLGAGSTRTPTRGGRPNAVPRLSDAEIDRLARDLDEDATGAFVLDDDDDAVVDDAA